MIFDPLDQPVAGSAQGIQPAVQDAQPWAITSISDAFYIKKTFALARQGIGKVSPNPLVGAVIVKDGVIISEGFHAQHGKEHAELDAIQRATQSLEGATLYCNLEPCCHTNKQTPPCAQRIIKEKFARVVIANIDPNPHVRGGGCQLLRDAGIEVVTGVCAEEGEQLNEIFFHYMRTKRPFIHLKYAQTLDGAIATSSGDSKWISNEHSRKKVHELRMQYDAILIGRNTLVNDNPSLTIRYGYETIKPCQWRIIMTDLASVEPVHHVVSDEFKHKTIIVTTTADSERNPDKVEFLKHNAVHVVALEEDDTNNLHALLEALKPFKITSLFVEGGSKILTSFVQEQLYDKVSIFIAPRIIGSGIAAIGDLQITNMRDAQTFTNVTYDFFEDNIYFSAQPKRSHI